MKKLISILLAVILAFSMMPITALAENAEIESDSLFGSDEIVTSSGVDYSAYDSAVKLVDELDKAPYTEESIKALEDSIIPREQLTTQSDVNRATEAIATAYSNLIKKELTVFFFVMDSNENIKQEKRHYAYGDVAEFEVKDTDEVATKWILSTDKEDIKLNAQGNSYSTVITEDLTITAVTDVAPEVVEQIKKVKFLAINGKVVDILYTFDVNNIEMPEAPKVPFYDFAEWVQIDETTYQAFYTLNPMCDGENHHFYVETIAPGCDTVGYLIFRCECGEAYSTEYVRPTGHNFGHETEFCLNGCGTYNPNYDDIINSQPSENPTVPSTSDIEEPTTPAETTKPNDEQTHVGFDEGGYNNMVIEP